MKTFTLKADVAFSAEDIDDALILLSRHFINIYLGEESDLIEKGTIELQPAK